MIKLHYPKFWQNKNLFAYLLLPFGQIFLLLGHIRKILAKPVKLRAHTICVGNATVGGTGKTQLVIKLAQEFTKSNVNFIILCKGYGGTNTHYSLVTKTSSPYEVGDEALELCEYGTTFAIPKISYASEIIEKYRPDVVLVDDGMQNPNFLKDFVIMAIDGTRGFGNGLPIPAGPMRCKVQEAINAADAIVIVGDGYTLPNKKTYHARIKHTATLKGRKYYAFAGIGNNERFFATLKNAGAKLIRTKSFPDHHDYSKAEILYLIDEAKELGIKLITTRKDYVKIKHIYYEDRWSVTALATEMIGDNIKKLPITELPVEYLEIDLAVDRLEELVSAALKQK